MNLPLHVDLLPVACEIQYDGPVSAIRATGLVKAGTYAAPIRFYDPKTATSPNLTAVGLETSAESFVSVFNASEAPVVVRPVIREATLNAPFTLPLPPVLLGPHATVSLNLDPSLRLFRNRSINRATFTIESEAEKGALVGAVTQVDALSRIVEDIPFKTSNPPAFARGSYPLRWDEDYTNLIMVTNTSAEVLRIGGEITAAATTYVLTRTDIMPGRTIVFDVDEWRRSGHPDVNGNVLPKDALYGKFHWVEMSNGKKAGLLGRTSLSSINNRRKSSFSCGSTCQYNYYRTPFFDPTIFGFAIAGTQHASAITDYTSQTNGNNYSYPTQYSNGMVYSDNTAASNPGPDSSDSTNLMMTFSSPGTANLDYYVYGTDYQYLPDQEMCVSNDFYQDNEGVTNTLPVVTFANITDIGEGHSTVFGASVKDNNGNNISSGSMPIHLVLSVAGSGGATFADGTVDMTITGGTAFIVNGTSASGSQGNVILEAQVQNSYGLRSTVSTAPSLFTVVNVVLSLQDTGSMATDNSVRRSFSTSMQSLEPYTYTVEGMSYCTVPFQITGVVTPSNYSQPVTLKRSVQARFYMNGSVVYQKNGDDSSGPTSIDSDPQSGGSAGKVYDVDSPGPGFAGTDQPTITRAQRANFTEYAPFAKWWCGFLSPHFLQSSRLHPVKQRCQL